MNWRRLTRVTAPTADPVSVAEAKTHLRVTVSDDDTYIGDLIARAASVIDGPKGIGVCMVSQQWKLTVDRFPPCFNITLGPLISVDAIAYVDGDGAAQTVSASDYRVMNAGDLVTIEPAYGVSWPNIRNVSGAVTVTFTAGYLDNLSSPNVGAVPATLKGAVLMLVAHWYENREIDSEDSEMPYGVSRLLDQYRVGVVAA